MTANNNLDTVPQNNLRLTQGAQVLGKEQNNAWRQGEDTNEHWR